MAEVLIRAELASAGLANLVAVQSAGTGDWHIGEPMDAGARAELARRGLDGSGHRARQISPEWLDRFDLVLAADQSNLRSLRMMAGGRRDLADRIRLLRSFDQKAPEGSQVPDPYGGSRDEFAETGELIAAAARGLAAQLAGLLAGRSDA
jgi:protein-tyrosine phosphatase